MASILVVDDESSLREFISRALQSAGHEVTLACDGGEGLGLLLNTPFDLLLTDIAMPVMDGIALALKAAKERPELPIVLMTGYSAERQRAHNLEFLAHEVVAKPFTLEEICQVVGLTLARVGSYPERNKP